MRSTSPELCGMACFRFPLASLLVINSARDLQKLLPSASFAWRFSSRTAVRGSITMGPMWFSCGAEISPVEVTGKAIVYLCQERREVHIARCFCILFELPKRLLEFARWSVI